MQAEASKTGKDKDKSDRHVDLGRCGGVVLHLSEDRKWLLIAFDVDERGFDKSGLNGFIDALKKVRDRMHR